MHVINCGRTHHHLSGKGVCSHHLICSTRLLSSFAGDGVLNFTEFIDLMVNDKPELEVDLELIEAFRCFDTGDTGMIGDQLLTRLKL